METMSVISILVLVLLAILIVFLAIVISRAVISKQPIIGKPPIPVFFFVFAKFCVVVNLGFLLLGGLQFRTYALFAVTPAVAIPALLLILAGILILIISSNQLKKDLIFGLPGEKENQLQTKGIYAFSRHPFYLGFLLILFSSCLLYPNIINILAFISAWTIHHIIMIREEEFLEKQYGGEYSEYKKRVGRYFTLS